MTYTDPLVHEEGELRMKFKVVMRKGHNKQQVKSCDYTKWSCDYHVTSPTGEGAKHTTWLWSGIQPSRHAESEPASRDSHVTITLCHVIQQQAMKDERHEMKKLVLAYEQRQEEEDYSGIVQSFRG